MSEQSRIRLEAMLASKRKMIDAAAKAIEQGRVPLGQFGLSKQQALDELQGRPLGLESAGPAPAAAALEAIVRRAGRPPLVVRKGAVELEDLDDFPPDIAAKIKAAEPFVGSAGRVEFVNHSMRWAGTGWVVDKKKDGHLVLTNRHVAVLVARRAAGGRGVFLRSPTSGARYGAAIDFNEEVGATAADARAAEVAEIVYLADDSSADCALLKIRLLAGTAWRLPDPIPLAAKEAEDEELVALVGYPAYDSRNDVTDMERYFRDLYDVKRFAPGRVIKPQARSVLSHDCTSLGGNSGSPLLSLERKAAVGLHFAGVYGVENSAVGVTTLKRLLKGKLVLVAARLEAAAEAADGTHSAKDLARRDGYDPAFLGKKLVVPWPKLPADIEKDLARPSAAAAGRPHELRYTHFSVKFSKAFRLPVLTAVNIDGKSSVHIKRGDDKWFFDERIAKTLQHGQKAYKDAEIDRGHMVRREDPNWGAKARQADGDTFHYTNAAPQHSALNQGKTLWQGLENHILNSARTHGFKACVITAPVFSDDDPALDENIRVPLEFWKVVAMVDSTRKALHATAYLLSQGQLIRKLLEKRARTEAIEGFVLGPYRTFQVALKDLEDATGYGFGDLKAADPLARTRGGQEATAEGVPLIVPLERPADIVL